MNESSVCGVEYLQGILFFTILSCATHWLAWHYGFFKKIPKKDSPLPTFFSLLVMAFVIYLAISLLIAPIAVKALSFFINKKSPLIIITYSQIFIIISTFSLLFLLGIKHRSSMLLIWKDPHYSHSSIAADLRVGFLTWFLSFPVVMLMGLLADLFIYLFFHIEIYEQVAVRYLKMTLESPFLVAVALFSILIFAPLVEEFLFRGLLQTWIKNLLGTYAAIFLTSFCFALFHLSSSQGMGNIPLFISLFTLGCYLGFIYEREGSLFASIGLHATFNTISTLRILLS